MASSNATVPLSCSECKRRKQKCNREFPCGHCLKRGVSHRCKFESKPVKPKAAKENHPQDGQPSASRKRSLDGSDNGLLPDGDADDDDSGSDVDVGSVLNGMGYMSRHLPQCNGPKQVAGVTVEEDDGQSDELKAVLPLMPEKRYTDCLVDNWLNGPNHQYYALYPAGFRAQYRGWWSTPRSKVTAELTSLILRVCACSLHFIIEENVRARLEAELDTDLSAFANRMHAAAEKLSVSIPPGKGGLVHVQQLFLTAFWFKSAGKFTEAWHALSKAIQAAIEIGLHQDSLQEGMLDFDREMRRRIWVILYFWDFSLNSFLSRPRLINHADCTVVMPSLMLERNPLRPDQPWQFRHMQLHCQLCIDMAAQLGASTDSDADKTEMPDRLRGVVEAWFESLPAEYAVDAPDTRWDVELKWVVFQRHYLHVIGYMSLFSPLRPFIMQSSAEPMSDSELRLREVGVDAALGTIHASLTLFENLASVGHKSPCAILCLFDAATVVCTGILQDEARTLPKREAVLEAMYRGRGMLAIAASENKATATLYRLLKRSLGELPLSPREKAVIGASKRAKDERTTPPSDHVPAANSPTKCAVKSASPRARRRQGPRSSSTSGNLDSGSAPGSSDCQPRGERSVVSPLPGSCRPINVQAPSNLVQARPSPVVPSNGLVQMGGHSSCSTFVPSTPIDPTYPNITESLLPATSAMPTMAFMAPDGYSRSHEFVGTSGFQYTSTLSPVDAAPFTHSGWPPSLAAMNGLGNEVQPYQAVNTSEYDNAVPDVLRCWEWEACGLGVPVSWAQSSAHVQDQGGTRLHPVHPGGFNGRTFERNGCGQRSDVDNPT
ncbi:hypothetical protein N658DRAFT_556074 [Parathielavia hyrcaniae]|uniref:Zn(2)-C6 fungal-type domain-containing protein n=1 Tax=Parathielavia hyrcaniae TaxID=113614 RepID=A0AAN6Q8Q1_9PEZI|nr:hypothetical protein N658DRAFT_556074 [Parathielavia hyrcaniae]